MLTLPILHSVLCREADKGAALRRLLYSYLNSKEMITLGMFTIIYYHLLSCLVCITGSYLFQTDWSCQTVTALTERIVCDFSVGKGQNSLTTLRDKVCTFCLCELKRSTQEKERQTTSGPQSWAFHLHILVAANRFFFVFRCRIDPERLKILI